jgi:hypothetical protein
VTPEAAIALAVRKAPFSWFETYGMVKDKSGKLVKPRANRMQSDLGKIYEYCRSHRLPCRIVGLKARQTGLSTGSMALMYHHLRNQGANGCVIGDEYEKSVKNLVNMFNRYAENDLFDWGSEFNPKNGKFTHGSELFTDTANDPRAGASNTFQFLDGTEVAHWPETGVRSAAQTLAAILNCVPELPDTVVILESTPNGASGAFYDTYQKAVTFDEFKAGKRGNGYIKIFYAWFEHPDYEVALDDDEIGEIRRTLTQTERKLIEKHGIRPGHIEFRRRTLASPKFNGDENLFDQEYPPDDVTCFLTSGRKKFNQDALAKMLLAAKANPPKYGILEGKFDGIVFRNTGKEESWAWIWEMPKDGCRYSLAADPMTGMSQTGGKDPDCHSVLVLREGYFDRAGKFLIPKVVARVFTPCRVDLDVLSDFIRYLTAYYGNCQFVPEANNSGIAVIELLKHEPNMNIYRRKLWNFRESKETEALGWQTKDGANREGTRSICIANLAALIREEGIDLSCEHLIGECQSFIVDDTGKAVAPPGKHDDDVLCAAIGVTTMEGATTYRVPERIRRLPADLRPFAPGGQRRLSKYC